MASRPGGGSGKRDGNRSGEDSSEGDGRRPGTLALPANLGRSLRYLDDEDLDSLRASAAAEARRRGRTTARRLKEGPAASPRR